jgi:hypothetical protein
MCEHTAMRQGQEAATHRPLVEAAEASEASCTCDAIGRASL